MSAELFPIVDNDGHTIGSATRSTCHDGKSKLLHPVVHLHVISNDGRSIYLQRRSMNKDIQPGKWDTAVGGHVDYGETVAEAMLREAREELGIDASTGKLIMSYIWESEREREMVNVHTVKVDPDKFEVTPDPVEVDEARFWSLEELEAAKGKGILTPNFEQEFFDRLLPYLS